jgi:hypothetical protein
VESLIAAAIRRVQVHDGVFRVSDIRCDPMANMYGWIDSAILGAVVSVLDDYGLKVSNRVFQVRPPVVVECEISRDRQGIIGGIGDSPQEESNQGHVA